jgi:hypothetical protein
VTFYGGWVKTYEDFVPNFDYKRTGCYFTTTHRLILRFSSRICFTNCNITVFPPVYFSLFPQLKIKLKGRHYYRLEMIEAESKVVLNILTEHDFLDAFKK